MVWQFWGLYEGGNRRYVTGVGTAHHDAQYGDIDPKDFKPWYVALAAADADMGGNYSGPVRIDRMIQYFNEEASAYINDQAMDVDIVGFSRGSAEARDFANRIAANSNNGWYSYSVDGVQHCQKVNFRFMGLFDTVLSTNFSDSAYNLAIPDEFAYVAQAVALNEHRGKTLRQLPDSTGAFPLESIMGDAVPASVTRIELGFIGAHADIGGGFGADENQLSQVALAWMVEQAKVAGVAMGDSPLLHTIIANPVVHDKSDNQYAMTSHPVAPGVEDREVRYQDGTISTQMAMTDTGMTWADTQQFISYLPADGPFIDGDVTRIPRADHVTGTVDMQAYLNWLNENGYNINMTLRGQ
jgi:hypothetical protein